MQTTSPKLLQDTGNRVRNSMDVLSQYYCVTFWGFCHPKRMYVGPVVRQTHDSHYKEVPKDRNNPVSAKYGASSVCSEPSALTAAVVGILYTSHEVFWNSYEPVNLWALKCSLLNIQQNVSMNWKCILLLRGSLKFYEKYLTHILKVSISCTVENLSSLRCKSLCVF